MSYTKEQKTQAYIWLRNRANYEEQAALIAEEIISLNETIRAMKSAIDKSVIELLSVKVK